MRTRPRARWIALITTIAALGALVPTVASGFHDEGDAVDYGEGVLRLSMAEGDTPSNSFVYEPDTGSALQQTITETRCEVNATGTALVSFNGTSDRGPGLFDNGLGVKSGGAQGVDCSRVDSTETLGLSLVDGTDAPLDGLLIAEAHLDVELKQSAEIVLTTSAGETFTLRSGGSIVEGEGSEPIADALVVSTSSNPITNCRNRADSGNDAGANDNCRWVIEDVTPFDGFTLSAGSGEFTLEGGDDGTRAASPEIAAEYGSDTLFFLTDTLDCGETISAGDSEDSPSGIITRLLYTPDGEDCIPKGYILRAAYDGEGTNTVDFLPDGAQIARYSGVLSSVPYSAENPVLQTLEYDSDGPDADGAFAYETMQWCLKTVTPSEWQDSATIESDVMPAGETWCIIGMTTRIAGSDDDGNPLIRTVWDVIGTQDPGFRFG